VALLSVASIASAGTIVRGNKATGGTAFVSGKIFPDEVNYDFDTVYDEINGEIDNDNIADDAAIVATKLVLTNVIINAHIKSDAAIAYSKFSPTASAQSADIVNDYSDDEDEQATTSDPGTSDATTLALHLETELAQLRYKIEQLTIGLSAMHVSASAATDSDASWIDGPYRPGNHIYNGGFDVLDDLATDADGNGWTRVLTPTTLGLLSGGKTETAGFGDGNALHIIDTGAALGGVVQTLDGLKADTRYLATVRVRDLVGTCRLTTLNSATQEMVVDSDDSNTWQVLSGTFETDATPTSVGIKLLAIAQSDSCGFDDVGVYEINSDPTPRSGKVHCHDAITTATVDHYLDAGGFADAGVTCSVTPPGPGYMITARGSVNVTNSQGDIDVFEVELLEDCGSSAIVDHSMGIANPNGGTDADDTIQLQTFYINDSPVPGETCTYTLEGRGADNNWDRNDPEDDTFTTFEPHTWVDVVMEPTG
jgi:hypothetical protein